MLELTTQACLKRTVARRPSVPSFTKLQSDTVPLKPGFALSTDLRTSCSMSALIPSPSAVPARSSYVDPSARAIITALVAVGSDSTRAGVHLNKISIVL